MCEPARLIDTSSASIPLMRSASSTARLIESTAASGLTITPLRKPRASDSPIPTMSNRPPSPGSQAIHVTRLVPMSRPIVCDVRFAIKRAPSLTGSGYKVLLSSTSSRSGPRRFLLCFFLVAFFLCPVINECGLFRCTSTSNYRCRGFRSFRFRWGRTRVLCGVSRCMGAGYQSDDGPTALAHIDVTDHLTAWRLTLCVKNPQRFLQTLTLVLRAQPHLDL